MNDEQPPADSGPTPEPYHPYQPGPEPKTPNDPVAVGPTDPMVVGSTETLNFGQAPPLGAGEIGDPPVRRRRRGPVVIAAGVVTALVLAGAAYAGGRIWYGWGATQPEEVLPGSVSAFARLDLSPGLGQRLKINNLAKKFPKGGSSNQDFVTQLKRNMFDGLHIDGLTYDSAQPWFGDRIGVAAWAADSAGTGCTLLALASTDDTRAKATLDAARQRGGIGYAFNKGYAVLAQCDDRGAAQPTADAAVAAAKQGSLASRRSFADQVSALPGQQTALAYVDLDTLFGQLGRMAGADSNSATQMLEAMRADSLKGQLVAGAQATDNGIDLRYRYTGGKAPAGPAGDMLGTLNQMPGNSVLAAVADFGNAGQSVSKVRKQLLGGDSPDSQIPPEISDGLDALFKSVLSISITELGSNPAMRIAADPGSAAEATRLAKLAGFIRDFMLTQSSDPVAVSQDGNRVKVTVGDFNAAGRLVDDPLYRETMAGSTGTPAAVAYLDVQKIVPSMNLSDADRADIEPIKAVGIISGYEGTTTVGLVRVVIR